VISILQWESEFFSRKIAVLDKRIDEVTEEAIEEVSRQNRIDVLVAKLPLNESSQVLALLDFGFMYAATNIRYVKHLEVDVIRGKGQLDRREIRIATEDDTEALQLLVASIFEGTRFSKFPFTPEEGTRLYREWIKKAILGTYDEFCVIVSRGRDIAGFYSLATSDQGARIGLIGVAPQHRGMGVGSQLILAASTYCLEVEINVLQVATQLQNMGANALYRRTGFNPVDGVHYFHRVPSTPRKICRQVNT
jgi:dTDP-4-amino-4,6-dideoxy-D-galactose acyltransferase